MHGGCQLQRALLCLLPFAFTQWLPPSLQRCPLCAHHAVPPLLSSPPHSTLLSRSVFPSPHLSLGLLFCSCMYPLCPSFRLSHTILFSPSVIFCLSSRRLPPSPVRPHALYLCVAVPHACGGHGSGCRACCCVSVGHILCHCCSFVG